MTVHLPASTMPGLDVVTDADRAWFADRPSRRYRLRPVAIGELLPGQVMRPGKHVVVVRLGAAGARMRVPVGRPPPRLRACTDRCCRELIERVDAAGYTVNGQRLLPAIREIARLCRQEIAA
jgi:hypothetical protein